MNIRLGSAPDSWGVWFPSDPKQIPWQRFLDEIAEAGYQWTELGPYGYLPTDLPTLRAELARRGLKVTATFAMGHLEDPDAWPALEKQATGGGELTAALGGRFLVLIDDTYSDLFTGQLTRPKRLEGDSWKRLIEATHRMADLARTASACNWSTTPMPKRMSSTKTRSRPSSPRPTPPGSRFASTPAIMPIAEATPWPSSSSITRASLTCI